VDSTQDIVNDPLRSCARAGSQPSSSTAGLVVAHFPGWGEKKILARFLQVVRLPSR
jgi:hypothetical protein